jgi:hypothetical protein
MVGVTGSIPVAPTTHSQFLPKYGDLRNMPAIGGLFYCALPVSASPDWHSAPFGLLSPRHKFPFLAPKKCGDENFTS